MNFQMLVNRKNALKEDFVPNELVITDQNENNFHSYKDPNLKPMIHPVVFEQFQKMQKDALKDNVNIIIDSGYRSYHYQKEVYEKISQEKGIEYAEQFVALPGCSEHQTGLAVDFAAIRNGKYSDDIKENDKESIWMKENAYRYGFILRYPKEKENITGYAFEPWHYRYVGIPLSQYLYQNNLTLEEYYD